MNRLNRRLRVALGSLALAALPLAAGAATIEKSSFGTLATGEPVAMFSLDSGHGMRVEILNYGGIIHEIDVPDRAGKTANVVLGYADIKGYEAEAGTYFGAIIGRYGNRIAKGRFTLDGKTYSLAINNPPNSLHGGLKGFDKVIWAAKGSATSNGPAVLKLTHVSPNGDQGFPGTLSMTVTYTLGADNALHIAYHATTDADTILNLTNHTYFNLAGESSGDVMGQELTIDASNYTPVDVNSIPNAGVVSVAGTPFDFRKAKPIGRDLRQNNEQLLITHGYDHNWVLDRKMGAPVSLAVHGFDPVSGRFVDVLTDQPGVQVYTGNYLVGAEVGTGGTIYRQTDGWTAETQRYPDSPNQPTFPTTELKAGQSFDSETIFTFGTSK